MIEQNVVQQPLSKTKPPTLIFTLMTLTNILINLDHGILPACTNQLKQTFDINDTQLGFLGSIVYLGIVLMGVFAGQFYQRINSKILTICALLALQGSLILFVLVGNKYLAYICRFLTGICQVFLLVYYPVWIDKFGENKKTLWLTLLQICVPLGIFVGYGMTAVVINLGYSFKVSFYIQILLVAGFILAFYFIPKVKLDSRRQQQQFVQFHENFAGDLKTPLTQNLIPSQDNYEQYTKNQSKKKRKHEPFLKNMKKILKSKMYLIGIFTMSTILFVSTGIQFWMTDYFVNVLHFDMRAINIAYAVVSVTGPTSGCGFGGFIINKIGGYENPRSIYYVFLFACIGIGSAVTLPFVDNLYGCAALLWIVLYFGGAMMPGLTGIMMVSVPAHLRAFGNSNGQIVKNIFGYLPAPFFYGWCNAIFKSQRAGMKLIMFWGLWAPLLLGIGSIYRYKQLKGKTRKQSLQILAEQIKLIQTSSQKQIDFQQSEQKFQNQESKQKAINASQIEQQQQKKQKQIEDKDIIQQNPKKQLKQQGTSQDSNPDQKQKQNF